MHTGWWSSEYPYSVVLLSPSAASVNETKRGCPRSELELEPPLKAG